MALNCGPPPPMLCPIKILAKKCPCPWMPMNAHECHKYPCPLMPMNAHECHECPCLWMPTGCRSDRDRMQHRSVRVTLTEDMDLVERIQSLLEADLNASNYTVIVCTVRWVNYSRRHRVKFVNLSGVWPTSKSKSSRYFQSYLFIILYKCLQ